MRVLFIARYLQIVNHRKVMALAAQPDMTLWHLAPQRWSDAFRTYEQELHTGQGYQLMIARTLGQSDIHRFVYRPPDLHLRSIRPDIIHIEEEPDSLAALQAVCARRIWAPQAKLVLFSWQNIRRPRRQSVEAIARFVLRRVEHAIAGNQAAVHVLRQLGCTAPISVLPQIGVDVDVFKPQDATELHDTLGNGKFVVGYVGRFSQEKGLDILIDAVTKIDRAHLVLLGRGPFQAEIESRAHTAGLEPRLTIINAVPHHEVSRYLSAMDILVLPSRATSNWKEQFGHVLIEAMACRVSVIGSDSGAIPEVIGNNGLIFPENDIDTLAQHIRRLIEHPNDRKRFAQLGLEHVLSNYTHECIARQTVEIYKSL